MMRQTGCCVGDVPPFGTPCGPYDWGVYPPRYYPVWPTTPYYAPTGWQCPVCGMVWAPGTLKCDCCVTITSTQGTASEQ